MVIYFYITDSESGNFHDTEFNRSITQILKLTPKLNWPISQIFYPVYSEYLHEIKLTL